MATLRVILISYRIIKEENISFAGGVPSMVSDLLESSAVGHSLDAVLFGGAPSPNQLPIQASKAFPTALMLVTTPSIW